MNNAPITAGWLESIGAKPSGRSWQIAVPPFDPANPPAVKTRMLFQFDGPGHWLVFLIQGVDDDQSEWEPPQAVAITAFSAQPTVDQVRKLLDALGVRV